MPQVSCGFLIAKQDTFASLIIAIPYVLRQTDYLQPLLHVLQQDVPVNVEDALQHVHPRVPITRGKECAIKHVKYYVSSGALVFQRKRSIFC
jgi:hypothetical protein